ncbi:uncharacterized protein LOC109821295 [Asparagus officinalis]|uniref:uncharacterized protein LOC109821295 n=1 Tax=Asparagus officinalis TaxID=4686 RepID=UPI00098E3363|nr:uncharacterized protein LOC109821295 [Asparagus officinalis]
MVDYDIDLQYHPGKVNVVPDALSRLPAIMTLTAQWRLQQEVRDMSIEVLLPGVTASLMNLQIQSTLVQRIKAAQSGDSFLQKCRELASTGLRSEFIVHEDGSLRFESRICISEVDIREELLREAHSSPYFIHYGGEGRASAHRRSIAAVAYSGVDMASIGMAPFATLYGRKCRSPLSWDDIGEREIFGPELINKSVDAVRIIREILRITQDRFKHWADAKCQHLEFQPGDHVFLKISPNRGNIRFGRRGKLSP